EGTAPYQFAVVFGSLPTGLTLAADGTLSGTPTAARSFTFTVTATDAHSCTGSQSYTIVVSCPTIALEPSTLPGGTVGMPYNQVITPNGGTAPIGDFLVISGSSPNGTALDQSSGQFLGAPTRAGTFTFTVSARDANGCEGTQSYTIVVSCPTITLSPSTLPGGTVGTPYGQLITASGGTAAYHFVIASGQLPTGLTLSSSGTLSGTPTARGSFMFTVTATDANGCQGTQSYTIVVNPGPTPTPTPTPTPAPTPAPPNATGATNVTANSFTANCSIVISGTGYRLDVSTSNMFRTYVSGYHNLDVGNINSRSVTGLNANTNYYYRVRAYNGSGTSPNSNVVQVKTKRR